MAVETTALPPIKGVKDVPYDELFVSGHRTCQGCESALVMRHMVKASGPRTIVLGSTGCMYVANTTYYTTPWVVPWMHTQLGASGSAALGTAAGLKVLMRKGKLKNEKINVIAFCGDGGGADMGLGAISATLTHKDYNCLVLLYDNESYANTDIQLSSQTPYGAVTTFSPSTKIDIPRGARRAMCKTERFSVMLILSPRNIASIRERKSDSSASLTKSFSVSSVTRFLE